MREIKAMTFAEVVMLLSLLPKLQLVVDTELKLDFREIYKVTNMLEEVCKLVETEVMSPFLLADDIVAGPIITQIRSVDRIRLQETEIEDECYVCGDPTDNIQGMCDSCKVDETDRLG